MGVEPSSRLASGRVVLSRARLEDQEEFIGAVLRSEKLHYPWTFPPRTGAQYSEYLGRSRSGQVIPFLMRRTSDGRLTGAANLSEPVMRALKGAYLGFYAFAGCERQGYMLEGLALVLETAFNELGFHRLEANVQPANTASGGLVARLGFRKEGFSPRYLFIDGAWRDHDRWAILSDEWASRRGQIFASRQANRRESENAQ